MFHLTSSKLVVVVVGWVWELIALFQLGSEVGVKAIQGERWLGCVERHKYANCYSFYQQPKWRAYGWRWIVLNTDVGSQGNSIQGGIPAAVACKMLFCTACWACCGLKKLTFHVIQPFLPYWHWGVRGWRNHVWERSSSMLCFRAASQQRRKHSPTESNNRSRIRKSASLIGGTHTYRALLV